ncbi:hypothetical protein TWF506_002577 [Arthrobotrys conoides]|uniref:Uncharacterized protein n=1 Tax=Arthrobotrys conoides TaxID=74498 RepID=A0AAN8NF87_9PEZI
MKSLLPFCVIFIAANVQALTQYPQYQYRVGYKDPIIEQYDATGDTVLVDDRGIPVLADFEFQYANLFGGFSCISVFPGANSLSLVDIPAELDALVGEDRDVGLRRLFGWVMYPGSSACGQDLSEEDELERGGKIVLSLEQAKYGYTQTDPESGYSGFPEFVLENGRVLPPSFRLFVNPEKFDPGVKSLIDLPFASVGLNSDVPREHITTVLPDDYWSDLRGDCGLDPNNRIVRQCAPFGGGVIAPEGVIDNIVPPKRRIRPGNPGYSSDINDYKPYPGLYPFPDYRKPMEVFRPINMLARLKDDLDSGLVTVQELEQREPELDAFAEAFMGLPFSTDPNVEYLVPTRYDWPPLSTLSYINQTLGLTGPEVTQELLSLYAEEGHTLSQAIEIAQTLNVKIEKWLEGQPADILGDWGAESVPLLKAEQWLYDLEEGTWEDTGSVNTIPEPRDTTRRQSAQLENAEARFDLGEDNGINPPGAQNGIEQSVQYQPPPNDQISDFVLDEGVVIEPAVQGNQRDFDLNFAERPDLSRAVNEEQVANPGHIYSNLGSRVLQDEGQLQSEDPAVKEVINDIINQVEAEQINPAEQLQNEGLNQDRIPAAREEAIEELRNEILDQSVLQQNPVQQNRIEEVDESEVRSQGAQSLANPQLESMDVSFVNNPLSQSQQLQFNNAQPGDLTSMLGELYSGQPRWLSRVRPGGRKRSPGPG